MVKNIDSALAAMPSLSAEQTAEVTSLRDEGDAQHKAGQHAESVETLQKAKDILGLE
jgi:Flp pilus assembly protein TadD